MAVRIVKLGGSLFDLPALTERFDQWREQQPKMATLILAGGGSEVDGLRERDKWSTRDPCDVHWEAIACLSGTARRLAVRLSLPLIETIDALRHHLMQNEWALFDAVDWLRSNSPPAKIGSSGSSDPRWRAFSVSPTQRPLPESWDVTSDSIAAYLALQLGASELVLLKSCPAGSCLPAQLARDGVVDRHFPALAAELPTTRWVNFRDPLLSESLITVVG